MSDKYKLNIGCHRRTITSRDAEVREFDTLEAAQQSIQNSIASWRRFGYVLWYAKIYAPDGTLVHDQNGEPYAR